MLFMGAFRLPYFSNMAKIHSYETFGTVDGPGVRFVVFLQGCPLKCKYCHNRDSWQIGAGKIEEDALETFQKIKRYKHYYILGGGVTVTGGEPLLQSDYVSSLFELCKADGLHTAIDTSGYVFNESVKRALRSTSLVMLDIKSIDDEQHKMLTSVSLKPIMHFLEYIVEIGMPLWVRHVVIPGITYNETLLFRLATFLKTLPNLEAVDVLSYHTMGAFKWKEMGLTYPLEGVPALSKEEAEKAKKIFIDMGLRLV